jgi:DNA mismatch repair protein MutS2
MQITALRALEFDRIVTAVRGYAATPMGDARLARLQPATDPHAVAALVAATTETVRLIDRQGPLPLTAAADLVSTLDALSIEARALEPVRLLALVAFLESVEETRRAIARTEGTFPRIERVAAGAASFKGEIAQVRAAIDAAGDIVDDASPLLRSLRDRLRKQRARLRGTLESYLRGKDTAKYLQDQVVTERNGRFVLVVRAEHRTGIPGIVHGASASGASLYLEPLSTVEINNDIVAFEEEEAEEVLRILLALTNAFRTRALDLQHTIEAATELDVLQARARYSDAIGGVAPVISSDGAFELQAARHPLLQKPVPVTIKIIPPATVLLVTGPNTGGKTVALKTAGLFAMMAQSGLRIPAADGSRLPVFRSIFADIGDEQSIEASLSTFSAHITNIASMDRRLALPALVLLDEVGSGTDPVEGGALGVAIIDRFKRRGATVLATSHYDSLKTYASTTEGVASAAFGFNAETFAPSYELIYGSPGRSLAIEIAQRLGLDASVIAAARQNLSAREAQLAEHLAKIDRDMRALEHQQRLVERARQTIEADEARLRQRDEALKSREETFRRKLGEELEQQARRARREIDDVIADLKARTEALARDAAARHVVSTGTAGAARTDARAAVEAVVERLLEPVAAPAPQPAAAAGPPPIVGDRVIVAGLGLEAVVTALHGGSADLDVRGKRMRAPLGDLRVIGREAKPAARVSVHVELQPRDTMPGELNVIGCTVDEALSRAERFLDEAMLGDRRTLRFVHGYGTGQLKRALAAFLQKHPLVAQFVHAPPEQGGGGVTVVELKE